MAHNTDGGPAQDEVAADINAMADAVRALSSIPTSNRRRIALDWLVSRVMDDISHLRFAESGVQRTVQSSPADNQRAHLDEFGK